MEPPGIGLTQIMSIQDRVLMSLGGVGYIGKKTFEVDTSGISCISFFCFLVG